MTKSKRVLIGLVAAGLLATTSGCTPLWAASNIATLVSGLLLGNLRVPAMQETCYRNGQLVDCATLPADVRGQ